MSAAVALWLVRGVTSGLFFIAHLALALRARGQGGLALVAPSIPRWRAGDRGIPLLWWCCLGVYGFATVATIRLR